MSSHNKRATSAAVGSDPGAAQDHMNVLYTAHQVHALAQIVYQKFTGGWSPLERPADGAFHPSRTRAPASVHAGHDGVAIGPARWSLALYYRYP
jgi:hypothetical protein